MSRIEELIKEKCPDGVEYIALGEATNMQRGTSLTKAKAVEGHIPVISGGKEPAFYCNKANREEPVITVAGSGASAGYVQYFESPIFANDCFTLVGKVGINTKYVYYFMESIQKKISETKKGAGVPHVHISDVDKFEIPVPPIEVQQEIVRILDKFTELEAELQAELDARKKQYEYYRDILMYNVKGRNGKLIEMLCQPVTDGPHTTPKLVPEGIPFISASAIHEGRIHFEDAQGFITKEFDAECAKKYKPKRDDVYMVKSGSTTGKVGYVDTDVDFNIWSPIAAMRVNNENSARYLFHLLQTKSVQFQVSTRMSHGSQPNLSMRVLEQFDVIIPTLQEQIRIVNLLEKYDTLCNDREKGLPAEIEARHKQYEYYRDKLLTFERKVV